MRESIFKILSYIIGAAVILLCVYSQLVYYKMWGDFWHGITNLFE